MPVRLKGTDSVIAKGGNRPRRGNIEVGFGRPLRFEPDADYREVAQAIRGAVAALTGETKD